MKQTIEIDVPDGYEVGSSIYLCTYRDTQDIRIFLKKKEPEYIEVRQCLYRSGFDETLIDTIYRNKGHVECDMLKRYGVNFIKWLDQDWRKVEI